MIDSNYNALEEKLKDSNSQESQDKDSCLLKWMKELMTSTVEKYKEILDKDTVSHLAYHPSITNEF